MAEHKFEGMSSLSWGDTFTMTRRAPAIGNRIFDTYSDALAFANDASATGTSIPGIVINVINDENPDLNGPYFLEKIATAIGANDAVIYKIGSDCDCGTF